MDYHQFIGEVQHRAKLGTTGEAVSATRGTLQTLARRLTEGEAQHVAAQLPKELGEYMRSVPTHESFTLDEFFTRVAVLEGADLPDAVHHARVVIDVLKEALTPGEVNDVRAQLPDEFEQLFEAGSKGEMDIDED